MDCFVSDYSNLKFYSKRIQAASVIRIILVSYGNIVVLDIELLQLRFEHAAA